MNQEKIISVKESVEIIQSKTEDLGETIASFEHSLHQVWAQKIFADQSNFITESKVLAEKLYEGIALKSNLYNAIAAIMPDLRLDFTEVFPKWQTYLNNFDLEKGTPKLPKMTSEKENFSLITSKERK